MPRRSCLTDEELKAFNLGDFPESALEELAAHLESCPRCEAAARALDTVSDDVVAAYRESALAAPLAEPSQPPEQVGGYEILEELGRGGMGVVYKARHLKLQRIVALKMLLGGSFLTSEERARFRIEAEAVARLRHPNIIQIYEVGEHNVDVGLPRPFFTLEYAAGGNLAGRLAGRPQPPRQAASWLEAMARAAHYAHQQGIIHRDLKPSNVLLTESGEPTICDFGVAKLMTGSDLKTRSGTLLGTAEYMAPEQAIEGENVGPAADVYSLGAILYTMLTGRPPFQGSNTLHILEQVRSQEPVPLRRLLPHLPRDLETICLKCLEKQPAHRYASAADLADDLRRFLADEPILARPAPPWERGWKWAKRRPAVAGLLAAVVVLAAVGAALVLGLWRSEEAQVKIELEKQQEHRRSLANITLDHGLRLCDSGDVNHGLLLLARALTLAEEVDAADLARVARVNLAVWRRRLVTLRAKLPHDGWAWAVAFSPDSRIALTGGGDRVARRWDTRTGRQIGEPLRHRHAVWAVSFSPDGRTILTGSGDDKQHVGEVQLWDTEKGLPLGPPLPHPDEVHVAQFSPKGKRFLTVCDDEIRLYEPEALATEKPPSLTLPARKPFLVLPHPKPKKRMERLQPRLWAIFSPKGELVLSGGEDGTARLWDAVSGAPHGEPMRHDGPVLSMAFSPDGKVIVTGSTDGMARLWDVATCRQRGPNLPHPGNVRAVAIRFDARFLVTGSDVMDSDPSTGKKKIIAGEVRVWHTTTGELFGQPMRQYLPVWSVAFRPGGGKLLTGSEDRAARFYSILDGAIIGQPLDHEGTVPNVVFSPTSRLALTASAGGVPSHARLWELAPGDPVTWAQIALRDEGKRVSAAAYSPEGGSVLGICDNKAREYDLVSSEPVGPILLHRKPVKGAYYSPDRQFILTTGLPNAIHIWDRATGHYLRECCAETKADKLFFSEDSKCVAAYSEEGSFRVYRISTGELIGAVLKCPPQYTGLILGPDGRFAYTHDSQNQVQEWDVRACKIHRAYSVPGPVRSIHCVAGKMIVINGESRHLDRAWDLETGQPRSGPLSDLAGHIRCLAFSPQGNTVLTGVSDGRYSRLWDAATGKPIGPPVHHCESIDYVAFTWDGKRMLSRSANGEFRAQDVPSQLSGDAERIRCWVEILTGMELNAEGTIHDLDPEALQRRRERLQALGGPPDGTQIE